MTTTTLSFTDHKGVSYELVDGPGTDETEAAIVQHHPDGETRNVATGRRARLTELLSRWIETDD